jgi:hypothetical protein
MQFSKKQGVLIAGLTYALASHASPVHLTAGSVMKATGKGFGELDNVASQNSNGTATGATGTASTSDLTNHNGPVMTNGANVYYIWYGTAWDTASKNLLVDMAQHIGGTPYFNINTTYYNSAGVHVKNIVKLAGQASVGYTHGTSLTDANILTIVSEAITAGAVPKDVNGVYMVLTDKTVSESSGFCTQYCGWHNHATIGGTDIKYAFVGDAETQCAAACGATAPSVNSLPGADGMASIVTRELNNTVTNPDLNGWYSSFDGQESADKCAWVYGTTSTASNGAKYNQTWGTKNYLIQEQWAILSPQRCLQHYP